MGCWLGIMANFSGPTTSPDNSLTWADYEGIVMEYPRLKLVAGIREIFAGSAGRDQRR